VTFSRFALLLLLVATSCDPATRVNDRGAATPAQIDESRRQALRACVGTCNRKHPRESGARVDCKRACLAIEGQALNDAPSTGEALGGPDPPWGIIFAMSMGAALAVLSLLF
jgi:hypothetical protein